MTAAALDVDIFIVMAKLIVVPAVHLDLPRTSQSNELQVRFSASVLAGGAALVIRKPSRTIERSPGWRRLRSRETRTPMRALPRGGPPRNHRRPPSLVLQEPPIPRGKSAGTRAAITVVVFAATACHTPHSHLGRPRRGSAGYQPRNPEQHLLYKLVDSHLDGFLPRAIEAHDSTGLPAFVQDELRRARVWEDCHVLSTTFEIRRSG